MDAAPNMSRSGIPVRGGAIQYRRVAGGHLTATMYGFGRRAFRINLLRDERGWRLEACRELAGVAQSEEQVERAETFLDYYMHSREPVRTLLEAKGRLRDIWTVWRNRDQTEVNDAL